MYKTLLLFGVLASGGAAAQNFGTGVGQVPGGWPLTGYSKYTWASDTAQQVCTDSMAWWYSGGRAVRFLADVSNPFLPVWQPSPVRDQLDPASRQPLLDGAQADSQVHWTGSATAPLQRRYWSALTFDAQNRLTGGAWRDAANAAGFSTGLPDLRYRIFYGAAALDSIVRYTALANQPWTLAGKRVTYYAGGQPQRDSLYQYNPSVGYRWDEAFTGYTYDAAGNNLGYEVAQSSGPYYYGSPFRYRRTYYADHRLKTSGVELLKNGAWVPFRQDSLGYSGASIYPAYQEAKGFDTGTLQWFPASQRLWARLRPDGYPDSVTRELLLNGQYSRTATVLYQFDAAGRPVKSTQYLYSGGSRLPQHEDEYFYYGQSPTAVGQAVAAPDLVLYPNPAGDVLYVRSAGRQFVRPVCSAGNAVGQAGPVQAVPAGGGDWMLSLHNLAPGWYWLRLTDGAAEPILRSFRKE